MGTLRGPPASDTQPPAAQEVVAILVSDIVLLLVSLFVILAGAEMFTNAVEWLGRKLRLSEGAVGSILAAVGTALPETMIPVVALVFGAGESSHDVGVGAIAGAPFMLATLAMFVTGAAFMAWRRRGTRHRVFLVNPKVINRDLFFFLVAYSIAVAATWVREVPGVRIGVAIFLLVWYGIYVRQTLQDEAGEGEELKPLHLSRLLRAPTQRTSTGHIVAQLVLALGCIMGGAHLFVEKVIHVSTVMHVPAVILALLIAPVATELPEKMNSVLWTREGKDTLAMGNITGALVFQSCFPVAIGVVLTPWALQRETLLSAILALVSTGIIAVTLRLKGRIPPAVLLLGGVFYVVFVLDVVFSHL